MVAMFFITYGRILNLIEIGRMFFIGTLLLLIGFFLLPLSFDLGVISLNLRPARNTLVFNLLAATPLSLMYLINRKSKTTVITYFLLFIATMLISRGRAGPIILVIEFLLILLILFPSLTFLSKLALISLMTVFLFFGFDYEKMLNDLSEQVADINPRLGRLLSEDRDATLGFDKSWLLRQLMIDKALEITEKHPFFGIGVGNFVSYDGKLPTLTSYARLLGRSMDYYNSRSAHNSYLQILSETGFLGMFFIAIILLRPLLYFFRILIGSSLRWKHLPLISLVGISIHFFVISSLTGAISWLVLGLAWSTLPNKKHS
jgi:O-antigen ligase